jgi:hypothetical protein
MAQKVNVLLVDDIDGSNAGETIPFSLDGTYYEIDLNGEHAHELRGQLERYVKVARKVTGPARRPASARATAATDARNKEVRSWAREQGLGVSAGAASRPASWLDTRRKTAGKPRPLSVPGPVRESS